MHFKDLRLIEGWGRCMLLNRWLGCRDGCDGRRLGDYSCHGLVRRDGALLSGGSGSSLFGGRARSWPRRGIDQVVPVINLRASLSGKMVTDVC